MWWVKFKLCGELWISHKYISVMGAATNCAFIGEENPREGCGIREVRHDVHSVDGLHFVCECQVV